MACDTRASWPLRPGTRISSSVSARSRSIIVRLCRRIRPAASLAQPDRPTQYRGSDEGAGEKMLLSMWTYPWDVLDLGFDTVTGELRDRAGLNGISLATSYHGGHFLQPRSPRRKAYFAEDGTIYFRPTPARWDGATLQPKTAAVLAEGDVLRDLVRNRDKTGLAVQCWTVCLHNIRLGLQHPHACTRNGFGDANYGALCPSNPDARAYAVNLVADLTAEYQPDIVELESIGFLGFVYEYNHEKDGVGMTAEDDFLLSLCFCDACLARAKSAGVDGAAAQRTVRRWIVEMCERPVPAARWPDFPGSARTFFRRRPRWRRMSAGASSPSPASRPRSAKRRIRRAKSTCSTSTTAGFRDATSPTWRGSLTA